MSEITDLTYYQRNRGLILNKAKYYYKNNKEKLKEQKKINTEACLKKKKIKRENIGRIGIIICLKKETKTKRISKRIPKKLSQFKRKIF